MFPTLTSLNTVASLAESIHNSLKSNEDSGEEAEQSARYHIVIAVLDELNPDDRAAMKPISQRQRELQEKQRIVFHEEIYSHL